MEIFNNKFLVKLIASVCLVLALFNVAGTSTVYASGDDDEEMFGSVLIKPVIRLLTGIADAIIETLQKNINEQEQSFIKIEDNTNWWQRWGAKALGIAIGVVVAVAGIVLAVYTGGASLAAAYIGLGAVIKICAVTVAGLAVGGYFIADNLDGACFPKTIKLPVFSFTSEEIFANEIALFDVNFFNPNKYTRYDSNKTVTVEYDKKVIFTDEIKSKQDTYPAWIKLCNNISSTSFSHLYSNHGIMSESVVKDFESEEELNAIDWSKYGESGDKRPIDYFNDSEAMQFIIEKINKVQEEENLSLIDKSEGVIAKGYVAKDYSLYVKHIKIKKGSQILYTIKYSHPADDGTLDSLVGSKIEVMREAGSYEVKKGQYVQVESTASQLSEVIAKGYFMLRNIAILVLLLVLLYSGIRVVIGSTAGEKAKYKERITDWLVAMCLIFIMHYIMVFSISLAEKMTELVKESTTRGKMEMITLTDEQNTNLENNYSDVYKKYVQDGLDENGNAVKRLMWKTDLMGAMKIQSQLEKMGTLAWVGGSLAYIVLVLYTLFFTWTYLRRVLYLAFLTIIAPFVAMTYPIDKITDGKAQAFNMWLREYIFNLLIQPMHLVLYTILVTSAYELAAKNIIYTLVAVGFMMPAEKLIRKFFGFEKAQTPGLLGGAAGAALAMTGLQRMTGFSNKSHNSSRGAGKEEKQKDIKMSNSGGTVGLDSMFGGDSSSGTSSMQTDSKEKGLRRMVKRNGAAEENIGEKQKDPARMVKGNGAIAARKEAAVKAEEARQEAAKQAAAKQAAARQEAAKQAAARQEAAKQAAARQEAAKQAAAKQAAAKAGESRKKLSGKMAKFAAINQDGFGERMKRTISGVSQSYARGLGNKALKRLQNGHPIRALLRGAGKLYGGALLGGAGLALAMASGDPNKLVQYTSAGIFGGAKLGGSVVDNAIDTISVNDKDMEREMETSWYGEEYKDVKYMEQVEEDLMSEENIGYIKAVKGYSRKEAIDFLDDIGRSCYREGVRDVEDMLAIKDVLDNQEEGEEMTLEQAIYATKLKNNLPQKMKNMSDKKLDEYRDTYKKRYLKKIKELHPDWTEQEQEDEALVKANQTIKYMKDLDTAKSDLTDVHIDE
jgi:hypothetical protein